MTKELHYQRGERLVGDALFLRDEFLPTALKAGRWNICVFESYRIIELVLKGIHLISGYVPRQTHEVNSLVDNLCEYLAADKKPAPFIYTLFVSDGDCLGLRFLGRSVGVFRRVANVYSQIGAYPLANLSIERALRMRLQGENGLWKLLDENGEVLLQVTDQVLIGQPLSIKRTLVRRPNQERIEGLKLLGTELRSAREPAFYHTQLCSEQDARRAVTLMELAMDALTAFFVIEKPL